MSGPVTDDEWHREMRVPSSRWVYVEQMWRHRMKYEYDSRDAREAVADLEDAALTKWFDGELVSNMSLGQLNRWLRIVGKGFDRRFTGKARHYWQQKNTLLKYIFRTADHYARTGEKRGRWKGGGNGNRADRRYRGGGVVSFTDKERLDDHAASHHEWEKRCAHQRKVEARVRRQLAKLAPTDKKPWKEKYNEVVAPSIDARINYTDRGGMRCADDSK